MQNRSLSICLCYRHLFLTHSVGNRTGKSQSIIGRAKQIDYQLYNRIFVSYVKQHTTGPLKTTKKLNMYPVGLKQTARHVRSQFPAKDVKLFILLLKITSKCKGLPEIMAFILFTAISYFNQMFLLEIVIVRVAKYSYINRVGGV